MIHPTAYVDPDAELASDVSVGAFAVIEAGVRVGVGSRIAEHAVVRSGSHVGEACVIDSFVVVGGAPQTRDGALPVGSVRIGARTTMREGVTVSRPTKEAGATVIGADCYLMANSHVGHDCEVGDDVTLANNVMLAGHVFVGCGAFLGGGAGVHQFVRIGAFAMVGGNASLSYDVPPYSMAAERNEIRGLNSVGLRRRRVASEVVADLKRAYHAVYDGHGDLRARAAATLAKGTCGTAAAGRHFLEFFVGGERGFARPRR